MIFSSVLRILRTPPSPTTHGQPLQKDSIQVQQLLDGDISQPQSDGHRSGVIRESLAVEDAETWLWAGSSTLIPSVLSSQPL